MSQKSSHRVLSYFQNLLESNKLPFLRDTAVSNMIEKYGSLVESYNYEKGTVTYWGIFSAQSNIEPIEALVTYDFYEEHKLELLNKPKEVNKSIDELIYKMSEVGKSTKGLLENINREIHYLLLRADKLYPDYPELTKVLKLIESHLLNRYQIKPYAKKRDDEKYSYFGIKEDIKPSLIEDLFWLAEKHQVIDIDVTDSHTFIKVLTGNPSDPNCVIHFKCFNYLVYVFLESIAPLFNSLDSTHIGKSKRFYTKKGEVLNKGNYDTIKFRYKDKSSPAIESFKKDIKKTLGA